jgi:asparagine N-glycosylation enzyme membrane subunit Stt3
MKKIRGVYALLSLIFLITGICIYLLFKDLNNMIFINWITKLEFTKPVFIHLTPSTFSNILMYNIPDMFWFISGILFLRFIWFYKFKEQKVYIICFYIMGAVLEISQLSRNIPGTFDFLDLFFMGIGALIEGLLYNFFIKRRLG